MFNQFLGEEGAKRVTKWVAVSFMMLFSYILY
jgi:hypothetical protein